MGSRGSTLNSSSGYGLPTPSNYPNMNVPPCAYPTNSDREYEPAPTHNHNNGVSAPNHGIDGPPPAARPIAALGYGVAPFPNRQISTEQLASKKRPEAKVSKDKVRKVERAEGMKKSTKAFKRQKGDDFRRKAIRNYARNRSAVLEQASGPPELVEIDEADFMREMKRQMDEEDIEPTPQLTPMVEEVRKLQGAQEEQGRCENVGAGREDIERRAHSSNEAPCRGVDDMPPVGAMSGELDEGLQFSSDEGEDEAQGFRHTHETVCSIFKKGSGEVSKCNSAKVKVVDGIGTIGKVADRLCANGQVKELLTLQYHSGLVELWVSTSNADAHDHGGEPLIEKFFMSQFGGMLPTDVKVQQFGADKIESASESVTWTHEDLQAVLVTCNDGTKDLVICGRANLKPDSAAEAWDVGDGLHGSSGYEGDTEQLQSSKPGVVKRKRAAEAEEEASEQPPTKSLKPTAAATPAPKEQSADPLAPVPRPPPPTSRKRKSVDDEAKEAPSAKKARGTARAPDTERAAPAKQPRNRTGAAKKPAKTGPAPKPAIPYDSPPSPETSDDSPPRQLKRRSIKAAPPEAPAPVAGKKRVRFDSPIEQSESEDEARQRKRKRTRRVVSDDEDTENGGLARAIKKPAVKRAGAPLTSALKKRV